MVSSDHDSPPQQALAAPPVMQPRLGIVHLMAWVFFSCLSLALYRAAGSLPDDLPENLRGPIFVANILQAIIGGAALGGFALWLWRLSRGGPRFPDQPGHYVLWVSSLSTVGWMLIAPIFWFAPETSLTLLLLLWALHGAATTSVALVPLLAVPARRWRVFWLAVVAASGLLATIHLFAALESSSGGSFLGQMLNFVLDGAVCLVLIGAVVFEIRAKGNMDWLSWAGVSLWLASGLSATTLFILFAILQ